MTDFNLEPNYRADPKIKFDTRNINQFMIRRGAHVKWEKSFLCTCRASTGSPQTDCEICGGSGFAFMPPVDTQMALQSMGRGTKNPETGLSYSGTALGTTTADDAIHISYRDRISFNDRFIPESLMFKVSAKDVTHGLDLRYEVVSIDYIVYGNKSTSLDTKTLRFENNRLYPTNDMVGKYLSVNLTASLRFYVVDFIREGRYQYEGDPRFDTEFKALPALLLLRREDMYIPSIINDDGLSTPIAQDPKPSLLNDDPYLSNFM